MNKKKMGSRLYKIREAIKSTVLLILVIALIVLVVTYIRGTRVYENAVVGKNNPESFDKLWSVLGGEEPEGLDPELLVPEFIGYKQPALDTPRGCVGDYDEISELYSLIKPCVLELFGKDSSCRKLSSTRGEKLFLSAQNGGEFVYMSYHAPTLYQLIYAYAAEALTVSASDVASLEEGSVGAYVKDIIIIPDNDFAAHRFVAYARDCEGNYYEFRPGDHVVASDFYISKLMDSSESTVKFDFTCYPGTTIELPSISEQFLLDEISCDDFVIEEGAARNELLRFFGYNPDKLDVFADNEEGTLAYIDSHSRLKIGKGILSFITSDAYSASGDTKRGIAIEDLLGYTIDGTPTLFEKITAVDNVIGGLCEISPSLLGGGYAELCLGNVYSSQGLLAVEYLLTYNNVRVSTEPFIRAMLTDDTVCELDINACVVNPSEEAALVLPLGFTLNGIQATEENEEALFETAYLCYINGRAEWIAEIKR